MVFVDEKVVVMDGLRNENVFIEVPVLERVRVADGDLDSLFEWNTVWDGVSVTCWVGVWVSVVDFVREWNCVCESVDV